MITEEILEWIATLPKWMRKLGYSIIDNKKISEEFLNETFKCFKIETKIEEGEDASEISIPYLLLSGNKINRYLREKSSNIIKD